MLLCVALLASTAALVGCSSASDRSSADPGGVTRVSADYYVDEGGVRIGIEVAFAQDRRVTGARLVWDGGHDDISPYPRNADPDVPLEFLDLSAGDGVLLEGRVLEACPTVPELPVFEVKTAVDGENVTERYVPDDASLFQDAFSDFCEVPFTVRTSGSRMSPDGDITITLSLFNPGPAAVTVVSEEVTSGETRWDGATATVAAGAQAELAVHGHSPDGCAAPTPWDSGRLLADGRPIQPHPDYDEWC